MGNDHQYCFSQMKTGKMRMAVRLDIKTNKGRQYNDQFRKAHTRS